MKNPPAFPRPGFATAHDVPYDDYFENRDQDGMTLRDYFAAKALQGLLANRAWGSEGEIPTARMAFDQADAMLKAREQ